MKTVQKITIFVAQQLFVGVAVVSVGWIVLSSVTGVGAQAPAILAEDGLERDITTIQRTYRGQFEEYRSAQQRFVVAKQESVQLGTLASLESSVQATVKAMVARDQVLETYLQLLSLKITALASLEPGLQEQTLSLLAETKNALALHRESTAASVDRQAVAERADEFKKLRVLYEFTAQFSREALLYAQLRQQYAEASRLYDELAVLESESSALSEGERQRALDEIRIGLAQANDLLKQENEVLTESLVESDIPRKKILEDVYVQLAQVAHFLEEVYVSQK